MKKRKLFIDTDAGTDDAIAIIMAMRDQSVDIVGISTSGGNVPLDNVVQNVLFIRELCNYKTPVYRGASQPLERILGTADFIHGEDGLGDIGLNLKGRVSDDGSGSNKIVEALHQYKHELEIICLGPLTNIALAEMHATGILRWAKKIYVMGGTIKLPGNVTPLAEYNIWADPEAADIVLKSGANMTMIGWDTTCCSTNLTIEELSDIRALGTPLAEFAVDIQQVRMKWYLTNMDHKTVYLADPIAMAVVLDSDLIVSQSNFRMSVSCGPDDDDYRGFIDAVEDDLLGNIEYIHQVKRSGFIQLLKESLQ